MSTYVDIVDIVDIVCFTVYINRLTMQQTYAHKFQCSFKLKNYPFDTQVTKLFDERDYTAFMFT